MNYSALHLAAFAGYLEMTESLLLQRDRLMRKHQLEGLFEIDQPDKSALTALMKASLNGHLEVNYEACKKHHT